MNEAAVRMSDVDELLLSGVLDYRTGPDLRKEGQALIKSSKASSLVIDCSAVKKSSSVGLSLLLCFMRDAKRPASPSASARCPKTCAKSLRSVS
jgi:phospholipid transport system transporter-binding protein